MKFIIFQFAWIFLFASAIALEELTITIIPEIDIEGFKDSEGKDDELNSARNLTSVRVLKVGIIFTIFNF